MKRRYVRPVPLKVDAEPGALLGPNDLGELMVVVDRVPGGVTVGFASDDDVAAAIETMKAGGPRSVTEARLWQTWGRRE